MAATYTTAHVGRTTYNHTDDTFTTGDTWSSWATTGCTASDNTAWNQWVIEWHAQKVLYENPWMGYQFKVEMVPINPNHGLSDAEYREAQQAVHDQMNANLDAKIYGAWISAEAGTSSSVSAGTVEWNIWVDEAHRLSDADHRQIQEVLQHQREIADGVQDFQQAHRQRQEELVRERERQARVDEERRLERERLDKIAQEEKAKADERAEALLFSVIPEEMQREYKEHQYITVRVDEVKSLRLRKGRIQNIEELDKDGKVVAKLCIHTEEKVPDADNVLAQYLFLQHSQEEFFNLANRTEARNV